MRAISKKGDGQSRSNPPFSSCRGSTLWPCSTPGRECARCMMPADLQKQHNEARELLLAQDFAQALPRYEKLARQCPGVAVIWAEYGNVASRLREVELADRAWHRAMQLDPR